MPCSDKDYKKLDKIARNLTGEGKITSLTILTPKGLVITINDAKYLEKIKSLQNPITQIINITSSAMATSSLSLSQKFQNISNDLEALNLKPKKLEEAKKNLNNLENEINKPNSSERTIKKILNWFSKIDLNTYLKIATTLTDIASKFITR
jgi:hypothetical protein